MNLFKRARTLNSKDTESLERNSYKRMGMTLGLRPICRTVNTSKKIMFKTLHGPDLFDFERHDYLGSARGISSATVLTRQSEGLCDLVFLYLLRSAL